MKHRWPQAECLHEHTTGPNRITNGAGQTVRIVAERCLDCGYRFPPPDTPNIEPEH